LYSPSIIITLIKLRKMSWAGHVAHTMEMRKACRILLRSLERKDQLRYLQVGRRIILKYILKKRDIKLWTVSVGSNVRVL